MSLAHRADAKAYGDSAYWDCSGILLGMADPNVKHTAMRTTRPEKDGTS